MTGLLEFLKTPAGQGLLSAGLGVAANAGRGGTWNAIGRGGLLGLQGYQGAIDSQQQQEDAKSAREFRTMQMDRTRKDYATEDQIRALAPKFFTPGTQGAGATDQVNSALPPDLQIGALGAIPAQPPKFDTQGYAQALMGVDPKQGISLMQSMQKDTPFNKVDPKDFTQESVARFAQSKNYADLVPARKMEVSPGGQVYNPYSVAPGTFMADPNKPFAMGPQGMVANTPYQQYETNKAKAGASRTDVRVNADKSYFGNVAEGLAKNDVALIDAARSAPERVASAQRVREVLARNPITGTGAEARLAFNKAFATAGLIDGKTVADTETLASNLASQTLDAIKTSGLGSGQGFTDKDRQFLERAKSGNIEMNAESLLRLADLNERQARSTIERGNAVIKKLRGAPQMGATGQGLDLIEAPEAPKAKASVVRQGMYNGRRVEQLSDGTTRYAN